MLGNIILVGKVTENRRTGKIKGTETLYDSEPIFKVNIIMAKSPSLIKSDIYLSLVMRKPVFCICENKDADQLRGNREADQRLCFRYIDSTISLLPKSEISSL